MQDSTGEKLADEILKRLLSRAENSRKDDSSAPSKAISLKFSQVTIPEYFALDRHEDKAQCNARLRAFASRGIIALDWDKRAGPLQQLVRVTLKNGDLLAKDLGVAPRWQVLELSKAAFMPYLEQFPVLSLVLDVWSRGRSARGTAPGETKSWLQSIQVLGRRSTAASNEIPVRRLSASLFGNSKIVEGLVSVIDALLQDSLAGEFRDPEDVFAEIGLVKFPSTMLLAGEMQISYGGEPLVIRRPYVGLAPGKVYALLDCQPVRSIISIENLTTFHEMAAERPADTWLLYTGGMPGPAWCQAYKTLLSKLPQQVDVYHWGDIDRGGFRIANRLAVCCDSARIRLKPYNMVGSRAGSSQPYRPLSASERGDILAVCRRWNWLEEGDGITNDAYEQESMSIVWPA